MQINTYHNLKQSKPTFKARFTQADIKKFMDSAKNEAVHMQKLMIKGEKRRTGHKPQPAPLTADTMYRELNAILTHVDNLKGKYLSLLEETLPSGRKLFKIVNEKKQVLGEGPIPILALDNAFVHRTIPSINPKQTEHKILPIALYKTERSIGSITEQDILSKALD